LASAQAKLADLGVGVVGVGPRAHFQATRLIEEGYPYPLLLDPDYNLAPAIGVGRQSLVRYIFNLRAWLRWVWAFFTHRRQGRVVGHYSNLPGTVLTTKDGEVVWSHRGTGLGDHPPLATILQEAEKLSVAGR
jgi:hypothetical protein